jgi:hypothetical protein
MGLCELVAIIIVENNRIWQCPLRVATLVMELEELLLLRHGVEFQPRNRDKDYKSEIESMILTF